MRIKALLFDFGGTIDTDGMHWSEKFWEAYTLKNIPVSKEDYEKAYVWADEQMNRMEINENMKFRQIIESKISLQLQFLEKNSRLKVKKDTNELIEDLTGLLYSEVSKNILRNTKLLMELSMKYHIGVVSNFYGNLETVMQEFKLQNFITTIIDSKVVGLRKPDPAIYNEACEDIGISTREAIVIGDDYEKDIESSKKIGCSTVWLDGQSWKKPNTTPDADVIIKSLDQVRNAIKRIESKLEDQNEAQ
ncbi:MAG: HAD family hydrolase [Candidatus Kapaibacterium sp.]